MCILIDKINYYFELGLNFLTWHNIGGSGGIVLGYGYGDKVTSEVEC